MLGQSVKYQALFLKKARKEKKKGGGGVEYINKLKFKRQEWKRMIRTDNKSEYELLFSIMEYP